MNSFCFVAVLFISFSGVISEGMSVGTREEMPGVLQIEECQYRCEKLFRRMCDEVSLECGSCTRSHMEHDGTCVKRPQVEREAEILNPGEDIDRMVKEHHHHSPKHDNAVDEIETVEEPKLNYKVHKVHHSPHHSQEQKVRKVLDTADADQLQAAQELPQPAYLKHPNPNEKGNSAAGDIASMADVYFLALAVEDIKRASSQDNLQESTEGPNATDTGTPRYAPVVQHPPPDSQNPMLSSAVFIAVVAGCSVAGLVGLVVAGVCWYRLQKNVKAASDVDYPAYGVTGPANNKEQVSSPGSTGGDRKLAQSAQMYHYQHQKQQMIALEKANNDMNKDGSEVDSEEENEEGDYTVFECPGLAPTGEMEVKNPLFSEETPVTPDPHSKQK